jgi:hypothetical protein
MPAHTAIPVQSRELAAVPICARNSLLKPSFFEKWTTETILTEQQVTNLPRIRQRGGKNPQNTHNACSYNLNRQLPCARKELLPASSLLAAFGEKFAVKWPCVIRGH